MDCSTQASLTFTTPWSLLKLLTIESMMLSNHLILCHPVLLRPSIFPGIRSFPKNSFQSLHLLLSRKVLNPFMVTSAPRDWQKTFCKKSAWRRWTPPSPKSYILTFPHYHLGFPGVSEGKESSCSAGDLGLIPGPGRSPGEGNGNPLLYSRLENPMDKGAWQTIVHGVAKRRTRLSNSHTHTLTLWSSFSGLSKVLSPGLQSSFCPK